MLNPSLTSRDHQDTMSGDPPVEGTTKTPVLDFTGHPVTEDYEDATLSQTLEEDEGEAGLLGGAFWCLGCFLMRS